MSKIESLVPPLDLCKKIPPGSFADSALVHARIITGHIVVVPREAAIENDWDILCPAPTLEEIMEALYEQEDFVGAKLKDGVFQISAWREDDEEADVMISAKSTTHAALSLWLKKTVENSIPSIPSIPKQRRTPCELKICVLFPGLKSSSTTTAP